MVDAKVCDHVLPNAALAWAAKLACHESPQRHSAGSFIVSGRGARMEAV